MNDVRTVLPLDTTVFTGFKDMAFYRRALVAPMLVHGVGNHAEARAMYDGIKELYRAGAERLIKPSCSFQSIFSVYGRDDRVREIVRCHRPLEIVVIKNLYAWASEAISLDRATYFEWLKYIDEPLWRLLDPDFETTGSPDDSATPLR